MAESFCCLIELTMSIISYIALCFSLLEKLALTISKISFPNGVSTYNRVSVSFFSAGTILEISKNSHFMRLSIQVWILLSFICYSNTYCSVTV